MAGRTKRLTMTATIGGGGEGVFCSGMMLWTCVLRGPAREGHIGKKSSLLGSWAQFSKWIYVNFRLASRTSI